MEMLKDNYHTIFLSRDINFVKKNFTSVKNHAIIPNELSIEDEPEWIADNFSSKDYILITDGYDFRSEYQKTLKESGFTLICIDDLADNHMYADLIINHSPAITIDHYSSENYSEFALGTNYSLLRKSFLDTAKNNRSIQNIDTAFICFGGADPNNLTFKAVSALIDNEAIQKINVVVGNAYQHDNLLNLENKKLQIFKNLNEHDLLNLMLSCNFAIAPSSTISFELCAVRMPILCGYFIDNQELIYKGLMDKNLIIGCGDLNTLDFNNLPIDQLLKKGQETMQQQAIWFDGKVEERFIKIIENYA